MPHPVHLEEPSINPKTGNVEVRFANFHLIYPAANAEYSCEELRAQHRGWLTMDWATVRKTEQEKSNITEPAPQQQEPADLNTRLHADAEPAPDTASSTLTADTEKGAGKLQIHVDEKSPFSPNGERGDTSIKLQIHVDEQSLPASQHPQNVQKKAGKAFAVLADEEPQDTSLADRDSLQDALKVQTVPLKGFEDDIVLNDENKPPSQLEVEKAKATKKARREERSNRTRKIKVMEVKEIRNETQTGK